MIAFDRTEVALSGEELATIFWRGRQWAVPDFGIERLDGTFSVPAPRLTESAGRSMLDWPLRIIKEPGADIDDFPTAFLVAPRDSECRLRAKCTLSPRQ